MCFDTFKNNVKIVEIENNSYCNRRCVYCINHYIDRHTENHIMPFALFEKIINELTCIDYEGELTFHRFNEPFYDKNEWILHRITYARERLPHASLEISTNGDFLDLEYLKKVRRTGLDKLYIQYQHDDYSSLSKEELMNKISDINQRIGGFRGKFYEKKNGLVYITVDSGFRTLTIQVEDYKKIGFTRGGIVKTIERRQRNSSCDKPIVSFPVDFNGKVCICHSTVSYHDAHKDYVIGDCNDQTIYDIYNAKKAQNIRKRFLNNEFEHICDNCDGVLHEEGQ